MLTGPFDVEDQETGALSQFTESYINGILQLVDEALQIAPACPELIHTKFQVLAQAGRWDELRHLLEDTAVKNKDNQEVVYKVTHYDDVSRVIFWRRDYFHFPGIGFDEEVAVSLMAPLLFQHSFASWFVRVLRFQNSMEQARDCLDAVDRMIKHKDMRHFSGVDSWSSDVQDQRDLLDHTQNGMDRAKGLAERSDYNEAIQEYEACLRIDGDFGRGSELHLVLHLEIGRLLMVMRQYARAAEHFTHVLDTCPDNVEALLARGECLSFNRNEHGRGGRRFCRLTAEEYQHWLHLINSNKARSRVPQFLTTCDKCPTAALALLVSLRDKVCTDHEQNQQPVRTAEQPTRVLDTRPDNVEALLQCAKCSSFD